MAKLSAKYELMVVFSLAKGEENAQALWAKFKTMIEENAELGEIDEWGKRKLAYPIHYGTANYETDGYYVVVTFSAKPDFPAELDRVLQITDGVLRSMITVQE
ncbi:MAG: 30S ribosomal protein S6 [Oscillospiraceae bacterium]|nr:30S ribosomal protein S6 [Oscillospiraceae bacterium]